MQFIRSLFQSILFYGVVTFLGIICLPGAYLSASFARKVLSVLGHFMFWSLRIFVGLKWQLSGMKNMPKNPALYVAQHQSMWETVALFMIVPNSVFVLKQSLLDMPLVGVYFRRCGFIGIDRQNKSILRGLIKKCRSALEGDHNIIIFPEGRRVEYGDQAHINLSFIKIASEVNVPIVPVTHNSGKFWPRKSMMKKQGVVELNVHKVINSTEPVLEIKETIERLFYDTLGLQECTKKGQT
ncbi:MAG: hypothetical protein CMM87_05090 [Rickettsiales bacterium]|nr:hypothetical protein [Rickettsiales bacterium]|tara:strand:- start:29955 stop:30674 length:720 start_codon:yes stop_codon:yes gene_type:complete